MDRTHYKESLQRELDLLTKMRDELKLQMHLAKADARDEWNKLEKNWSEVQDEMRRASADAKVPIEQLGNAAKGLIEDLKASYERMKRNLKAS